MKKPIQTSLNSKRFRPVPILRNRSSAGQALVEFSLVLSLFLFILVGIIDFGRMIFMQDALNKVVREAARAGAVRTTTDEAILTAQNVAKNLISSLPMIKGATIYAQIVRVEGVDALSVTANQMFVSSFTRTDGPGLIPSVSLNATATMRKE